MSHEETPKGRSEKLIPLVRKTFGDQMIISADANGSYTPAQAIPIGKLMQEYKYAFYEEPVPFDWYEETRQVADVLEIPIGGGEQEPSTYRVSLEHRRVRSTNSGENIEREESQAPRSFPCVHRPR